LEHWTEAGNTGNAGLASGGRRGAPSAAMSSRERFAAPDPDVRVASTPPGWAYGDSESYEAQRERVLARGWHCVGDEQELPSGPGAVPVTLLPGCLDEPLLISRDEGGELRCLSNVCTHRGALLLESACAGTSVRCPYHGRRFGLDGGLRLAPGFEDVEGFPSARDDLPAVPFAQLGPLMFAGVSPSAPFDALLDPVRERLAFFPWEDAERDPDGCRDFDVDAHWALWCDNYLEGLHIPYVHPALSRSLDLSDYRIELHELVSLQIGIARRDDPCLDLPPGHPDHGQRIAGYYLFLFPATTLNFYPWGASINLVRPMGPRRTRIRYRTWVTRPELRDRGAGAALERVEREDDTIVERTQRGVGSRFYRGGRYAARHEAAVHHFHRLLARHLDGER